MLKNLSIPSGEGHVNFSPFSKGLQNSTRNRRVKREGLVIGVWFEQTPAW